MLLDKNNNNPEAQANSANNVKPVINEAPYEQMFNYLQKLEREYNTNIIIMYHPSETLNHDGSISFNKTDYTDVFAKYAKKHGITFADMTADFLEMYENDHHVPHGFITGLIGSGHLNKYGHAAIAERMYTIINEAEGK